MCEQCKEYQVQLNEEKRLNEVLREKNHALEAVNRQQTEMIENLLNRLERKGVNYPPRDPMRPWRPTPGEWKSILDQIPEDYRR
jgi:hypothetical protein